MKQLVMHVIKKKTAEKNYTFNDTFNKMQYIILALFYRVSSIWL